MSEDTTPELTTEIIGKNLPYLRRYARALTGSQSTGDKYAVATLEAILADDSVIRDTPGRVGLFRVFHSIWVSSGAPAEGEASGLEAKAQAYLSRLTANTREALLLHSIEEFPLADVATIMDIPESEATALVDTARKEMHDAVTGKVLIIEDEAIIAMDLQAIVEDMGHSVTGNARTRTAAVDLATKNEPDLILADIQLADNSSGIDAVNDLMVQLGERPVIFITAFPERLLTGDRPEPAFLIAKPYSEDQVRSAISQAMFFASTQTLRA